jgi:hypothetical protein
MLQDDDAWFAKEVRPDYTMDVRTLYRRVSALLIHYQQRLDILESCEENKTSPFPSWVVDWSYRPDFTHRNVNNQFADMTIPATHIVVSGDVLEITGVICDSVEDVEYFDFECISPYLEDKIPIVNSIVTKFIGKGKAGKLSHGNKALRSIIRSLVHDHNQDHDLGHGPEMKTYCLEDWETAFLIFHKLADDEGSGGPEKWEGNLEICTMLSRLLDQSLHQRSIIRTKNGRHGLAPGRTKSGDVVAILLGLSTLAVLRPKPDKTYEFSGATFVHGLNWGEGLAGPLPEGQWKICRRRNLDGYYQFEFFEIATETFSDFDSRIN